MKAWKLEGLGGRLSFVDVPAPPVRAGTVRVRIEASVLMSYMADWAAGRLPGYRVPDVPFTPGGNGVGVISEVGPDVWHLRPGQRVVVSPHLVTDENVPEPGQMLLGVTSLAEPGLMVSFPDGTFAEEVVVPKSLVTPVRDSALSSGELAAAARFLVPYGGLLRGRLAPGETVLVVGATGAYGGAAVRLALALGAERVIAAGRNPEKLAALAYDPRIVPMRVDAMTERVDLALDLVGSARDPDATLAALRSLRRGGRLVLMGSMSVPLPVPYLETMLNAWEILGQFMYPADAVQRLLALFRAGLLDPRAIARETYPLAELPAATAAAARTCVVLDHT